MRIASLAEQISGTLLILLIPVLWPDKLALLKVSPFIAYRSGDSWVPNWAVIVFLLGVILIIHGQWSGERSAAKEQRKVSDDLDLMASYAAAVKDSISSASLAHGMKSEERLSAQIDILKTIASILYLYYGKQLDLDINACQMLAYAVANAPADVAERAKQFIESGRNLDSYAHVLDLTVWAENGQPKQLSLPVEDPTTDARRLKLLPGAPAAFALRKVQIIESTDDIKSYFGPNGPGRNLDGVVREAQITFFSKQGFKSFVSIPIGTNDNPLGVVNVQSNRPHILGRRNKHKRPVMNLLEPLLYALQLLIIASPGPK